MGRYLATGLIHEMIVDHADLKKKKISKEELKQEIENDLLFDLKLYDETEDEEYLLFKLKDEALETYLIPFLEAFLPKVFDKKDERYYLDLLQQLRSIPVSEWINLAKKQSNYAFRYDPYGESCYIYFEEKPFKPGICVRFNSLMLYLGHGKISTEGIGDFLHFFKYSLHETFKEHPIVKAIRVYITG